MSETHGIDKKQPFRKQISSQVFQDKRSASQNKDEVQFLLGLLDKAVQERENLLQEISRRDEYLKERDELLISNKDLISQLLYKASLEEQSFRGVLKSERASFERKLLKQSRRNLKMKNVLVKWVGLASKSPIFRNNKGVEDILYETYKAVPSCVKAFQDFSGNREDGNLQDLFRDSRCGDEDTMVHDSFDEQDEDYAVASALLSGQSHLPNSRVENGFNLDRAMKLSADRTADSADDPRGKPVSSSVSNAPPVSFPGGSSIHPPQHFSRALPQDEAESTIGAALSSSTDVHDIDAHRESSNNMVHRQETQADALSALLHAKLEFLESRMEGMSKQRTKRKQSKKAWSSQTQTETAPLSSQPIVSHKGQRLLDSTYIDQDNDIPEAPTSVFEQDLLSFGTKAYEFQNQDNANMEGKDEVTRRKQLIKPNRPLSAPSRRQSAPLHNRLRIFPSDSDENLRGKIRRRAHLKGDGFGELFNVDAYDVQDNHHNGENVFIDT